MHLLRVLLYLLLSLVSLVLAAPLDVYAPPVLYPSSDTVWKVGETHTVEWDVHNPPEHITNQVGRIQLRRGNSTLPLILASDFDILLGSIEVVVPSVPPGKEYRIVLFGDSGNWSPAFAIIE